MLYIPTIGFVVDIGIFVVASADVNDISAIFVDELLASVMKTLELSARQASSLVLQFYVSKHFEEIFRITTAAFVSQTEICSLNYYLQALRKIIQTNLTEYKTKYFTTLI